MELKDILQEQEIDNLKHHWGRENNVIVYRNFANEEQNEFLRSYLIPIEKIDSELQNIGINELVYKPGCSQIDNSVIYKRFNSVNDVEPIVIERNYFGLAASDIELIEEFRLLFNLYFDKKTSEFKDLENDTTVAVFKSDYVSINQKYLRLYLGFKKSVLVLFKDNKIFFNESILYNQLKDKNLLFTEESNKYFRYSLTIRAYEDYISNKKYYSSLLEKKIVFPLALENCGIWPYIKEPKYVDFIIGIDDNGKNKLYTCNPNELSDSFGKNKNAPHYLTSVFFKKEVLDKYRKDDRYTVGDGKVSFGSIWSLDIDNLRDDNYICVYLGDLGRDLPNYKEQQYWASFNVVCDASLSSVKYERDFLAEFSDPVDSLNVFKSKYLKVKELSRQVLGWSLYIDLKSEDEYVFRDLYIPSDTSQSEFDNATLLLAKLMNDAINIRKIKECLILLDPNIDISKLSASIKCLEKYLEIKHISNFSQEIRVLRDIQELRSSSSAHVKGSNYSKAMIKMGIDKLNYGDAYRLLLKMASNFLEYIEMNIELLR